MWWWCVGCMRVSVWVCVVSVVSCCVFTVLFVSFSLSDDCVCRPFIVTLVSDSSRGHEMGQRLSDLSASRLDPDNDSQCQRRDSRTTINQVRLG